MTDTQYQVGKVYATRGGDRVRVTHIHRYIERYPVRGDFLDGGAVGQDGAWTLGGRFSTAAETPCDLLPEPAAEGDRVAELEAALRQCQAILAALVQTPNGGESIVHLWAQAVAAETAARTALEPRT